MKSHDYFGWVLLALAVGLGVLAYVLAQRYLAQESARLAAEAERDRGALRSIVVASRDLLPGDQVSDASMAIAQLPARHLSHRSVSPQDYPTLRGHVLNRAMVSGEPLLRDFVAGAVIDRFSDLVPAGDRALTLEVTALDNHAGMLVPGDFVDLLVDLPSTQTGMPKTQLPVLERVRIVAAGPEPLRTPDQGFQPLPADAQRYRLISIIVAHEDAERVLQAQSLGVLRYLLRNPLDQQTPARAAGRRFFGDDARADGYVYFSNAAPRGQRHIQPLVTHEAHGTRMSIASPAAVPHPAEGLP